MSNPETDILPQNKPSNVAVKLVVLTGPDAGRSVAVGKVLRIGSANDCQLQLHDAAVSAHHAVVSALGGHIAIRDLDSRNGTYVGQTRIREADINAGALITVGKTTLALHPQLDSHLVPPSNRRQLHELYGESIVMRRIFTVLERAAPSDVTVLIEGESGTGKELAARAIHRCSARSQAPYVVFDCASVPRELAESELFGHRRGAFSGAVADRQGAFQQADGGTLCLDEVGELPLDLQPKLLRVLETGELRQVGSDVTTRVNVRVLAATNRELRAEAQRGAFRSDLLYRLDVVRVRMPALRQRPEDVAGLTRLLLAERLAEDDEVGGDNLRRLQGYNWPGNVRELRNVLLRALALATPPVRFDQLHFHLAGSDPLTTTCPITIGAALPGVAAPMPYKEAKQQLLAGFDGAYVNALLQRHGGNISQAARAAGLSRRALYDLLDRTAVYQDGDH